MYTYKFKSFWSSCNFKLFWKEFYILINNNKDISRYTELETLTLLIYLCFLSDLKYTNLHL